jgi:hypothetical protein
MDALPEWPAGTAAVLSAQGPRAIPVSTATRLADDRIAFALARRRETLERIRAEASVAICFFARGACFTAYGTATVVREPMESSPNVAALVLEVDSVQDHLEGARTSIDAGVAWRWTEDEAAGADRAVRDELAAL